MSCRIHPSILSADFANYERELNSIAAADLAHVDVMDGHFVPNLTIGLPIVTRLAEVSPIPLDVHLMIEDPDRWAPGYAQAGAASVTFHAEAAQAPVRLARAIRDAGAKVGVAIRPATAVEPILDLLEEIDMVLVMTVEPGFGGQSFIEGTMSKIRHTRQVILDSGLEVDVQVDGGIGRDNITRVAEAGANVFVAGSSIFAAPNRAAEIDLLRKLATGG